MTDRVELKTIICKGAKPGPRLLITGGVHGDEFEPMVAIRQLSNQLDQDNLAGTVTMVPVVNEDAFYWCSRTAEDDLDLARTCPGDPDGSITQRTAHELSKLIRQSDYYIDLHTGGTVMSIYPLAGYTMHSDLKTRQAQHEMAQAFNLPLVWGSDPTLDGRSLSVARDANVPAIYVEYHGAAVCDPVGVDAMIKGCLNVMSNLKMLERLVPESQLLYDVQETEPDSGFFQLSHLATCDGFFETAVTLGDIVEAGDLIGWIVDPLGANRVEVFAESSGLVNCLRTFPSVKQNDCLAYIVDIGKKS